MNATIYILILLLYQCLEIDGLPAGRIVFGLFGKVASKTVENFMGLCKCDRGLGKMSGMKLCYKGTKIHRISKFKYMGFHNILL